MTFRASFLAIALMTPAAAADGWLVAETPAAVAISDAQAGVFRPGAMPAVGLYTAHGAIAVGARLRLGVLRNGPPPGDHLQDPGVGGLGTAALALRTGRGGGWVEAAAGLGVTGRDVVPTLEVGAGWSFDAGAVDVGPSVRFARVVSPEAMATLGSADLVLVGLDVRFGRARPAPPRRVVVPAPAPAPAPVVELAAIARDPDRIVEREPGCTRDVWGCPIDDVVLPHEGVEIVGDRIILDDRVLFDVDRARVKTKGRAIVHAIADAWEAHPAWARITIEGHADVRGPDAYNVWLSTERAARVRAILVERGFAAERIDIVGHGRGRPRDAGTSERAHQRNRRVEFVISTEGATP